MDCALLMSCPAFRQTHSNPSLPRKHTRLSLGPEPVRIRPHHDPRRTPLNDTLHSVSQQEWTAEFQFRASGPERAGGNLQLWYAKDGQTRVGTSSIYTVGQFDGFALVIDTHGGRVRLNPLNMNQTHANCI